MTIREELEMREHQYLSPYASFSDESAGRDRGKSRAIYARCTKETGIGFYIVNPFAA